MYIEGDIGGDGGANHQRPFSQKIPRDARHAAIPADRSRLSAPVSVKVGKDKHASPFVIVDVEIRQKDLIRLQHFVFHPQLNVLANIKRRCDLLAAIAHSLRTQSNGIVSRCLYRVRPFTDRGITQTCAKVRAEHFVSMAVMNYLAVPEQNGSTAKTGNRLHAV